MSSVHIFLIENFKTREEKSRGCSLHQPSWQPNTNIKVSTNIVDVDTWVTMRSSKCFATTTASQDIWLKQNCGSYVCWYWRGVMALLEVSLLPNFDLSLLTPFLNHPLSFVLLCFVECIGQATKELPANNHLLHWCFFALWSAVVMLLQCPHLWWFLLKLLQLSKENLQQSTLEPLQKGMETQQPTASSPYLLVEVSCCLCSLFDAILLA